MKSILENIVLVAIATFLAFTFYNTASGIYASYKNREEKRKTLARFYAKLSDLGWRRLSSEEIQPATQDYLDRYYSLRSRTLPTLKLIATTAYCSTVHTAPALFMVVYEKVDVLGAPIAAGRQGPTSEFQGTVAAATLPLPGAGRTMIYRRPPTEDDDPWDWSGDTPLLGAREHRIEAGLDEDFRKEFTVKSTDQAASIPLSVQELLLHNTQLFGDSGATRSALVIDEHGWGYASTVITDAVLLDRLVTFQNELVQRLLASANPRK